MRYLIAVIICVLGAKSLNAQSILLKEINVVNVITGEIHRNQYVWIKDGVIKSVTTKKPKSDAKIIHAKEKYLVPGLWDMHTHLTMIGEPSLPLFVINGITSVRDMGGDMSKLIEWKAKEDSGDWTLPMIKTPGAIIESPQFYSLVHQLLGSSFSKTRIPITSPSEVPDVIDSLQATGIDFIKIRTIASIDVFEAIANECNKRNIAFTGHIDPSLGITRSVKSGMRSIEHTDFFQVLKMTDDQKRTVVSSLTGKNVWFTPTFLATKSARLTPISNTKEIIEDSLNSNFPKRKYLNPTLLEAWLIETQLAAFESPLPWDSLSKSFNSFARMLSNQTALLAGTDVGIRGIIPGWSLHEELQLMVEKLGITPLRALQAATIEPAKMLEIDDQIGSVEVNKVANLLLLDDNPLNKISNTQQIHAIIKNGIYIDQETRTELLNKVEKEVTSTSINYETTQYNHLKHVLQKMKNGD